MKMWLSDRRQDTKVLFEKCGEAKLFKSDFEVPGYLSL